MKLLLIFALFLQISFSLLVINDFFDEVHQEFASKVVQAGDDVFPLGKSILMGGFLFIGPKISNISTLKRTGDAQIKMDSSVRVLSDLYFDKLVIEGEKIEGPITYEKPEIAIRKGILSIDLRAYYDNGYCKWSCDVKIAPPKFIYLNGESIKYWLQEVSYGSYITDPVRRIIEKNFDFCQTLAVKGYKMFHDGSS